MVPRDPNRHEEQQGKDNRKKYSTYEETSLRELRLKEKKDIFVQSIIGITYM